MPAPEEYKFVAAWGKFLGSHDYYIKEQQELAAAESAPLDAIYRQVEAGAPEKTHWNTVDDIKTDATRGLVKHYAAGN